MSRPSRSRLIPTRTSELPETEVADDLDPLHRVDVGVQVSHPDLVLGQVLGEVLGHSLRQRRHQHPIAGGGATMDLREQIVDLCRRAAYLHLRVDQSGWTHDLLHDLAGVRLLVRPRRRRHEDGLRGHSLELVEPERPVVERRRQPESVLDQGFLARAVAAVHCAELGHGHVALVDEQQRVGRKIVEQGRRRLSRTASRQEARVVLDPLAVADLGHHLDVEPGPLLQPLGFDETAVRAEHRETLAQLLPDFYDGIEDTLARGHVVALGVHGQARHAADDRPGQRIEPAQVLDLVVEELDAHRIAFGLRRVHVDDLAAERARYRGAARSRSSHTAAPRAA